MSGTAIRLTQLSHAAGCGCKLGSAELARVLGNLVPFRDVSVLVDAATSDDAAVYRLDDERAIVATVDFFTPIVDDPYDFGRIAATNAISDIYAMGARPLFGLNLVAFPRAMLGDHILEEIVRGGGEAARDAGMAVVGGHSIDDAEPKFGMCVVGEVHPERIVRNAGARPGDALVLTKALGTGIITTALKREQATPDILHGAVKSMSTLNAVASRTMLEHAPHAATDVTGYGLMGHLGEMLRASDVGAVIRTSAVPVLDGARELAARGLVPGGTRRNIEDSSTYVIWNGAEEVDRVVLCDAQTSGGLLIALERRSAESLVSRLQDSELPAAIIGEVVAGSGVQITT